MDKGFTAISKQSNSHSHRDIIDESVYSLRHSTVVATNKSAQFAAISATIPAAV